MYAKYNIVLTRIIERLIFDYYFNFFFLEKYNLLQITKSKKKFTFKKAQYLPVNVI